MSKPRCRVCESETSGFLCKPCLDEVRFALTGLPGIADGYASLLHELSMLATHQTRVYRATSNTTEEPVPYGPPGKRLPAFLRSLQGQITLPSTSMMVNLGAGDLLAEASNLAVTWARHLHEARGVEWFPDTATLTVVDVLTWLADNIETIRWDDAAEPIHAQVTDMHRRMTRAVDRSPSRLFAGPCEADLEHGGRCARPLFAWPAPRFDSDYERADWEHGNPILCDGYRPPHDRSGGYRPGDTGCGFAHSRTERRDWMIADIEDRLLPFTLLQDSLPGLLPELTWPTRSTWFRWRQKHLPVKAVIDGTEFYRGGDLIDLCRREQQRIKGNTRRAARMSA